MQHCLVAPFCQEELTNWNQLDRYFKNQTEKGSFLNIYLFSSIESSSLGIALKIQDKFNISTP
jgi:hypothetical protein